MSKWSDYIDRKNKVKISRICSSVMSNLNGTKFTMEVPSTWERPQSKFKENSFNHSWDASNQTLKKISSFFLFLLPIAHLTKIAVTHKHIRTPIRLKFGALVHGPKANLSTKFGVSVISIPRVISTFIHKTMLNFCHAYRLNHCGEQVENRYVARLNIRGVPFWWL